MSKPYPHHPDFDPTDPDADPRPFRSGRSKASLPMRTPMEVYHRDGSRTTVRIVRKFFSDDGGDVELFEATDGTLYKKRPFAGLGLVPYQQEGEA